MYVHIFSEIERPEEILWVNEGSPTMQLFELDPHFLVCEKSLQSEIHREVETLVQAQGLKFLCPKCFTRNNGSVGTHAIVCWSRSRGAPDTASPKGGRWRFSGTGFYDLSLDAETFMGASSIALNGGCCWHGYITDGSVIDA